MDESNERMSTTSSIDSKSSDSVYSQINEKKFRFFFKSMVKQEEFENSNKHESNEAALYGVQMNPYLQINNQYIFSTIGKNRASIFECESNGKIRLKQTYVDSDLKENFYCCCWSYICNDENFASDPLLIIGGVRGIIRVINILEMKCIKSFKGHGNSINDLKVHPRDANIFLSVSKDHSLRLWNIRTETCVAIFGGVEGHRDEVLSADFHLSGFRIISCGMDHALKIWKINNEKMKNAISASYKYNVRKAKEPFKTAKDQFPVFTTRNIHRNYVDSVSWYGNFVLSKSCENSIVLWKPGKLENSEDIDLPKLIYSTDQTATVLHKFECSNNEIWFIRFSMDQRQKYLALGNQIGGIFIWKINSDDPTISKCITLSHPKCTKPIRQTCFSLDGKILIAISDDSSIWRWELKEFKL